MSRVDQLEAEISRLTRQMFNSEMADDFYYTNGSRRRDLEKLTRLEKELRKERNEHD